MTGLPPPIFYGVFMGKQGGGVNGGGRKDNNTPVFVFIFGFNAKYISVFPSGNFRFFLVPTLDHVLSLSMDVLVLRLFPFLACCITAKQANIVVT